MLKKIAIVVAVLVAGVLAFATTKPDTFHVERAATIQAPPEKVYAQLANFRNWSAWSPWDKLDPEMKRKQSGAPEGVGAVYEWEGNSEVGKGRMEILEADPSTGVTIKLDFLEPMEAHNTARFALTPEGSGTKVVWSMDGPCDYMSKVMQVFVSLDSMVGPDFEKGLANLKAEAEK